MCGIAGFNWNDGPKALKMAETLKHRGPDQTGHYADASVSLGHCRLSIIDLSERGRQPMSNEDGSLWLVCNGEIYNFQDIRRELGGKHVFSSATDIEVILHAYEEWGTEAFRRFNGMWAFCLYDRKAQTLVLSRDRLGKKPLYYARTADRFIFASELKAIVLQHPSARTICREAVDLYFSLGYIPSPWTIYEGMAKLEPRQSITYDLRNHTLTTSYYDEIPRSVPLHDRKRLIAEGRDLLQDATRLRLVADVPVGAFLSGGLDSSAVVAAMSKETDPSRLHTFSIGFEGAYDETRFVEVMKEAFKTNHHHQYFVEADFERIFEGLTYVYDEPFQDLASYPTFELSRLARRNVTVCLSGDGGDEIFGGYRMHRRAARAAAIRRIPAFLRRGIGTLVQGARPGTRLGKLREVLRLSFSPPEDFYLEADGGRRGVYQPDVYRQWSSQKMRMLLDKTNGDLVQAVIYYDLYVHTLPDFFLVKVDRASMAWALEVRCPFLDYRFLDFAARLPARWKASRTRSKILLRRIIRDMVPAEIGRRKKQGFTPPILEWIRKEKYQELVRKAVERLHAGGTLDQAWHDHFVTEVLNKDDGPNQIMRFRMLVFWMWWKRWMKASPDAPPRT